MGKTTSLRHFSLSLTESERYAALLASCEMGQVGRDNIELDVTGVIVGVAGEERVDALATQARRAQIGRAAAAVAGARLGHDVVGAGGVRVEQLLRGCFIKGDGRRGLLIDVNFALGR